MTTAELKAMLAAAKAKGFRVAIQDSMQSGIHGSLEHITADNWVGVRGPGGRLDEIPAERAVIDPT